MRPSFFLGTWIVTTAILINNYTTCAQEVRFTGALTQNVRGEDDQVLRRFEVLLLKSGDAAFFSVLDDERVGCPWPESFGSLSSPAGPSPHLIYRYDGSLYTIPLPPLTLDIPGEADEGDEWANDDWSYRLVNRDKDSEDRSVWQVAATERRGRRQALQIDAATEILLQANVDVFMGQGDRFTLTLTQTSSTGLSDSETQASENVQSSLIQLQRQLGRRPDTQTSELSARQLELTSALLTSLREKAQNTPLQETIIRISRDVERQKRRVMATKNRQDELINRPAPSFALNLIDGQTLSSDSLEGKVTVLHFWDYKDKPLSEPYGQVGYLDFLFNRRKTANVAVVGISTNPALQSAESLQRARRSAKKLVEFMNTSYPVGYDDGSLLRAFGDPRETNGQLPLWVVLSADGKIVHYQSGFYEIDRQRGLKELDEILIEQVRLSKE